MRRHAAMAGSSRICLGELETVHFGHHSVDQSDGERLAPLGRGSQSFQRRRSTRHDRAGAHPSSS